MNYTSIFLDSIKPNLEGIDEIKERLDNSMDEYKNLDELVFFIGDDSKKIIDFPNQDLINNYLSLISKDEKEYQAIKYLVSTNDKKMRFLPQYVDSVVNLESLAIGIRSIKNNLSREIDDLSSTYYEKWLNKKYYDIFSSNNIYLSDPSEFSIYLKKLEIPDDLKVNILGEAVKCNNIYYQKYYDNKDDYIKFINDNRIFLLNKFKSLEDSLSKYVNLDCSLEDILSYSNRYDLENLLLAKKIWIVNKVNDNYLNNDMNGLNDLIKDFNFINTLENKNKEEIERIIKEGH